MAHSSQSRAARIIICASEPDFSEKIAHSLKQLGYEVAGRVTSVARAILTARETMTDLVLMDLWLASDTSDMQGGDRIRQELDLPVIYFTRPMSDRVLDLVRHALPRGHLVGPSDLSRLGPLVEEALAEHERDKRLRSSDLWMKVLFEGLREAVFIVSPDRIVLDLNPAAERMFGHARTDILGRSTEILHVNRPDYDRFAEIIAPDFRSGKSASLEYSFKRKNGEVFPSEITVSLLTSPMGEPLGIASIVRDMTERKRSEAALRESEERFRRLFDQSPIGAALVSLDFRFMRVNEALCRITGYTAGELASKGFPEITHPDDVSLDVLQARMLEAGEIDRYSMDKRYLRPDGSPVWTHLSVRLVRDEKGQPMYYLSLIEDITARKSMEQALEESETFLRETGRMAKVGGWELYPKTGEVRWTEETYAIHEMPRDRTLHLEEILDLFYQADRADLVQAIQRAVDPGEPYDMELRITTANGRKLWTHMVGRPVRDNETTVKVIGSVQDITAQKKVQKLLEREVAVNAALADLYVPLLSRSSTIEDIATIVLEKALHLTGSEHGYASEIDEVTGDNVGHTLTRMVETGCEVPNQRVIFPKGPDGCYPKLYGHSLNTLRSFFTNSPETHASSEGVPEGHVPLTRFLSVPVTAAGTLLGQIAVANSSRDYTDEDVKVVERLAQNYALGLERKRWEDALRRSERSLELALSAADLYMWELDLDTRIVSSQPAAWSLFGFPPETVSQPWDVWLAAIHPEDRPRVLERFETIAKGEYSNYGSEYRIQTLSGDLRWVAVRGAVVDYNDAGRACRLVGTIRDITQKKATEEQARSSYESFINIVESSGDGILVVSEQGDVLYANSSAGKMFGLEPNLMLGLHFGIPMETHATEIGFLSEDSPSGTAEMKVSQATWRGQSVWLVMLRDVTERKHYEQALQNSEERFRSVIETSPVGIKIVQDGQYKYVNPAFLHLFGYKVADEVLGLPVQGLYVPNAKDELLEQERLAIQGETDSAYFFERKGVTKKGETLDVNVWLKRIEYEGRPSCLGFVVDASREKTLRAQLLQAQKMEAIGTLAGGIAHDFNNVLTVISGFTELLLLEKQEGERDHADLEKIATAAAKGAELVQSLLAFSKKAEIKPRPVNLNHEIEQVLKLMTRTIPKMISIETDLSADIQAVNADPGQVEQVLMNLMVNAKDAMPDGGRIAITTRSTSLGEEFCRANPDMKPGEYVQMIVSDSGHGMDSRTAARIFEPFFTTKRQGQGTGLGLAMVYGILKQHRGLVTCFSEPGRGTTFYLYWPVLRMEVDEREPSRHQKMIGGTETILLVDDDDAVRDLGRRILTRVGYTVLTATNGREGLEIFKRDRDRIALILLDLIMPEMGGKECLAELLNIDPHVKVVLATGYSSGQTGIDPVGIGARGLVKKPYDVVALLTAIRQTITSH